MNVSARFLWKAPPPNMYRLKAVLGFRNHDPTRKQAPAWSFIRYVPPPKPKPTVSLSPTQKKLSKKRYKKQRKNEKNPPQGTFSIIDGSKQNRDNVSKRFKKTKNIKKPRQRSTTEQRIRKKDSQVEVVPAKERMKKFGEAITTFSTTDQLSYHSNQLCDMCPTCFPWARKHRTNQLLPDSNDRNLNRQRAKSNSATRSFRSLDSDIKRSHSFFIIAPSLNSPTVKREGSSPVYLPTKSALLAQQALPALPPVPNSGEKSPVSSRKAKK